MKEKIAKAYRWFVNRLPEALLLLFLTFLLPFLYLAGVAAWEQIQQITSGEKGFVGQIQEDPWTLISIFICLAGTAAVVYLLLRSRDLIWAVARKMIIEALNRKTVLVLIVFFLVLMPSLPFILKTEGSLKSQVQITFMYALTLAEVLLSLVAIFVTTASICREIEEKQVHVTDSKPLPRWQFLAGKLLGIVVMCSALLFVMAAGAYGLVAYMSSNPDYSNLSEREIQEKKQERQRLANEVLVSRTSVRAPLPDVEQQVEQELQRLEEEGQLAEMGGRSEARNTVRNTLQQRSLAVPPMSRQRWVIRGLTPPEKSPHDYVYARFKLMVPGASQGDLVQGRWTGWLEQGQREVNGSEQPQRVFVPMFRVTQRWKPGSFQELRLPAQLVTSEGTLHLSYMNMERSRTVIFPVEQRVEVLQQVGTFMGNYYRSLVVIMFHIVLLAALGLMAGALFSFPVASLLVVFIFGLGIAGPWFTSLTTTVRLAFNIEDKPQLTYFLNAILNNILFLVFTVVPHFAKNSPLNDLVSGRLVSWSFVSQVGAMMVFIKGGIATLIGVYFYSKRELARVIV